jgi:prepilin-type N-terminal cleavage/methylation domain-containing protein
VTSGGRRSRRRGFSLIEALVALIIAAIALSAALELQRQLADGQRRYQRALTLAGLERDAMALTAEVNPTLQPQGAVALAGGRSLRWTATPRTGPELNAGSPGAGRRFELRLYRMGVRIFDADGAVLGQLNFDRVGWRRLDRPAPFAAPAAVPVWPPPPAPPTGQLPARGGL